jgi:hypothetical protein
VSVRLLKVKKSPKVENHHSLKGTCRSPFSLRTRSHGLPACLANDQVLITHQTILKLL